jgi:hypothetical protein
MYFKLQMQNSYLAGQDFDEPFHLKRLILVAFNTICDHLQDCVHVHAVSSKDGLGFLNIMSPIELQ